MTTILLYNNISLNNWRYYPTNTEYSLKLNTNTELSFYPVDPYTGDILKGRQINLCSPNANIYSSVLKTKTNAYPQLLFIPFISLRTHTVRDLFLDTFFPLTRRFSEIWEKQDLGEIAFTIATIFADLLTLIVRIFTLIPRAIYNSFQEHPAKIYFSKDTQAVFVECKRTWQIQEEKEKGFQSPPLTIIYRWRVDFYSPLQYSFDWNGQSYSLDANFGAERVVLEDSSQNIFDFCQNAKINEKPISEFEKTMGDQTTFLNRMLETSIIPITVTFC